MNKRFLWLLPVVFLLSNCTKVDTRVLGVIDNKPVTVSSFLSSFFTPSQIKENQKEFTDEGLQAAFRQYATFYAFAKKADSLKLYDKEPYKSKLKTANYAIKIETYSSYLNEKEIGAKLKDIKADKDDLKDYKKRVQVRHILFSKEEVAKDPKKIEQLTSLILDEVKKGTPFADLAKKYSQDPGTASNGGLLEQWIYKNSPLVDSFKKAALDAKKAHEIIPNVVSPYGVHIIYIEAIENRSISDIKKSDPYVVQTIVNNKKNKFVEDFNNKLKEKYKDLLVINHKDDVYNLLKDYKTKGDTVLAEIKGEAKLTVNDYINNILADPINLKYIQSNDQALDVLNGRFVLPALYVLYAKSLHAENDTFVKDHLATEGVAARGSIYMDAYMKENGPKPAPTPKFSVTDKEVTDYYNANKDSQFTQKDKDGKMIVIELNANTKKEINSMLLQRKEQDFKQQEQLSELNFINTEAEKLFKEYNVTLNTLKSKEVKSEKKN